MSRDYNIYLKSADDICARDFELYAFSIGLQMRVYPLDDYPKHSGFLPFNLRASFIERELPYDSFLSGFAVYSSPYADENDGSGMQQTMMLELDDEDCFETLVMLVFAGYLCKSCGGVLYDPQTDQTYEKLDAIEHAIEEEKQRLNTEGARGMLYTHRFEGWK